LTIARFSKDEQRKQSAKAQHRFNRANIEATLKDPSRCVCEEVSDEGISGELRDRPGIEYVRDGIVKKKWDVIVAEDSSRVFRNYSFCYELIALAVDNGIRVICINDDVDTAEPDWPERLQEAQGHHCKDNRYTRRRLERTIEDLWLDGAAVGHLRSGYVRTPTVPETEEDDAEGPFYDSVSEEWGPKVSEVFQRVDAGERLWSIADWLTSIGMPKLNGKIGRWTKADVIRLIRCTLYKGVEQRGKTKTIQKFVTGKSAQLPNDEEVREREMPHLRIVSDALWAKANRAIDDNGTRGNRTSQQLDHQAVRRRATRQRDLQIKGEELRQLLSDFLICGICKNKMYADGRNEGGYRCSDCMHERGCRRVAEPCWNKATALRDVTHANIATAIYDQIVRQEGVADVLVAMIGERVQNEEHWNALEKQKVDEIRRLEVMCHRLEEAIEAGNGAVKRLVERLIERQRDLQIKGEELRQLLADRDVPRQLPTADEIRASLRRSAASLLSMDPTAGSLLKKLVGGRIEAVPYQQFGSNKVVLRAEFELHLVHILPVNIVAWLACNGNWSPVECLPLVKLRVDLFKPSTIPANAVKAAEIRKTHKPRQITAMLDLAKCQVFRAVKLGQAMAAAGITDPYVRLDAAPVNASRWWTAKPRRRVKKRSA